MFRCTLRTIFSFHWAPLFLLVWWIGTGLLPLRGDASELRRTPIVRASARATPSVVNIRGEKTVRAEGRTSHSAGGSRRVNGMGTGVVIDARGYIITNHHVVEDVQCIEVTLADGEECIAKMVAYDPETDLAIIKIELPEPLQVITIGTSSDLMQGETVLAVGNAYGYEHTLTVGIISALHRAVPVSDAQFYDDLIQTDASINPGNSGGPLLNIDGEMIGINVAVRAGAQGIGFAIPADKALSVAADIIEAYSSDRTWHGITLASDASKPEEGVIVSSVDLRSPAASIGLRSGDVITMVAGMPIERALDFHRAMIELDSGKDVNLVVDRAGETMDLQFELAAVRRSPRGNRNSTWSVLGINLKALPAKGFQAKYQTRLYHGGLAVTAVRDNSPASDQGIRSGDVLVGMHIWEMVSAENVAYVMKHPDFRKASPIKFLILRGDRTLYGYFPVGTKVARLDSRK